MEDRKKSNSINISYDELMKELDSYRITPTNKIKLTKKQIEFIKKCRTPREKVPHQKMAELWEQLGWGKTSEASIRRRTRLVSLSCSRS